MAEKEQPDHRLESATIPEDLEYSVEIYAAANFESKNHLSRRDFLREGSVLAGMLTLAPLLLQGCATTQNVKIKVPQKVRVKKGTALFDAPGGNIVRTTDKEEVFDFLEEKGDWVKVGGKGEKQPLWVRKMESVYEQFTEKTLPCGAPIPAGYVCTCNCVPVSTAPATSTRTYCKCDQVCTCNLIPVS